MTSVQIFYLALGAACFTLIAAACMFAWYLRLCQQMPKWKELKELEGRVGALSSEEERLGQALEQLRSDHRAEKQAKQELVDRAEKAQQWLEENGMTLAELRSEIGQLQSQHENARQALDEVESALMKAQEARQKEEDELRNTIKDRNDSKEKLDSIERHLKDLREQHNSLQEHIQTAENSVAELKKQKHQAELDLQTASKQLSEISKDVETSRAQLQETKDRLDGATREHHTLKQQNRALQAELEDGKARLSQLTSTLTATEEKCELATGRLDALKRLTNEKELDLQTSEKRLAEIWEEIEKSRAQLEELKQKVERAEREQRELIQKSHELQGQIGGKQAELKQLAAAVEAAERQHKAIIERLEHWSRAVEPPTLEKRLQDLHRPYITPGKETLAWSHEGEDELLSAFENALQERELAFSPRMIRAFHTSLKIADQSPLVVLAGISGTGKSLLPRLYADFMGIHFLNVAVQPRWDGPQDLFGFYNYMENRYKATELARLLWQMDKWNCRPAEGSLEWDLQKGLALVLLDEMNLARIEYYFSELLSKLEVRRGLDPGDDEKRRQAEIEIECGPFAETGNGNGVGSKKHSTRLFVGSNILFAGTMNEDETTQMLSPKVVDRANVLRFGKPEKPTERAPKMESLGRSEWLKASTWESWRQHAMPADQAQRVRDALGKANGAMQGIGRPFGYRIQHAVEAYVAAYPGSQQPEQFNHALADQIEQKLIPKLLGLDTGAEGVHVAFDAMKALIQQTEDKELLSAFGAAKELPVFQWSGVNRETRYGAQSVPA